MSRSWSIKVIAKSLLYIYVVKRKIFEYEKILGKKIYSWPLLANVHFLQETFVLLATRGAVFDPSICYTSKKCPSVVEDLSLDIHHFLKRLVAFWWKKKIPLKKKKKISFAQRGIRLGSNWEFHSYPLQSSKPYWEHISPAKLTLCPLGIGFKPWNSSPHSSHKMDTLWIFLKNVCNNRTQLFLSWYYSGKRQQATFKTLSPHSSR